MAIHASFLTSQGPGVGGLPLLPSSRVTLGPTSEELLLFAEALSLLVTDLMPVFYGELLHGQLQVLLLLGYKVSVLREGQ